MSVWTRERLGQLRRQELLNLQANAGRLGEAQLAALCAQMLTELQPVGPASSAAVLPTKAQDRLLSRSRAFGARSVWLHDARTSWSGIRKSDGMVVIALWQAAVQTIDGGCTCLLWSPNRRGGRPWSDSAAGRERLEHCRLAMKRGAAEGLLVQGEALDGRLPEDLARSVFGIDSRTVIHFKVEQRGAEYWAAW